MAQATTQQVQGVSHITVLVNDEEKALAWYQENLGCEVRTDQQFEFEGQATRWLTVGFPGSPLELVLMKPMPGPGGAPPDEAGNGTMTVLNVADCRGLVGRLKANGVTIVSEAEDMPWGVSAVIRDLDGNPYNLVQTP